MSTSNVITFPAHKYRDGNYCETCYGALEFLPTHCPGVPMSLAQRLAIKRGEADFFDGKWVYYEKTHS